MTRCVFGRRRWISSITSIARMSPSGLRRELVGAVAGAHAIASASTLVARDEIDGLVGIGQQLVVAELALDAVAVLLPRPRRVSSEPSTPSSPSTEAPTQCAMLDDAAGDRRHCSRSRPASWRRP